MKKEITFESFLIEFLIITSGLFCLDFAIRIINNIKGRFSVSSILTALLIILTIVNKISLPYILLFYSNCEKQRYITNNLPVVGIRNYFIDITETKVNQTIYSLCKTFDVDINHVVVQESHYYLDDFLKRHRNFIDIYGLFKPIFIIPNYIVDGLDANDTIAFLAQRMYSTMKAKEQYITLVLTLIVIFCFYAVFRFVEFKSLDDFCMDSTEKLPPSIQIFSAYLLFLFMFNLYRPFLNSGKRSVVYTNDCRTLQMGYDIQTALKNYTSVFNINFESSSLYSNYYSDTPSLSDRIKSLENCVVLK